MYATFYPRDLYESIISFKDILIKCALPSYFKVKLNVDGANPVLAPLRSLEPKTGLGPCVRVR
jgi:hypothetical protein